MSRSGERAEIKRASGTGPPTFINNVYKIYIYEISDAFNQNVRVYHREENYVTKIICF